MKTEFEDVTLSHTETVTLDMATHFSGNNLTYEVLVTTTNQRTGQQHTGKLNEIALNKVTGTWQSQTLTLQITATNPHGEASGSFSYTLDN